MPTLTGLKVNPEGVKTYMKQVSSYDGKVHADIIYTDKDTDHDYQVDLWYCSARKSFGSTWNSAPREQNWIDAHAWADKQLALMLKYGTVKVQKAEYLRDRP